MNRIKQDRKAVQTTFIPKGRLRTLVYPVNPVKKIVFTQNEENDCETTILLSCIQFA